MSFCAFIRNGLPTFQALLNLRVVSVSPLARCVQLSLPLRNRGKLALKLAHIFLGSADLAAAVPIFEDTPDFCSKLSSLRSCLRQRLIAMCSDGNCARLSLQFSKHVLDERLGSFE